MVNQVKKVEVIENNILKQVLDVVYVQRKTKYYRLSKIKQIISLNETHEFSVEAKRYAQKNFITKSPHYKHCFFEPFICPKSKEVKGVTVSQLSETTLKKDKITQETINNNVLLEKRLMPLNKEYAITAAKKRDFIFDSNVGIESFKEYLNSVEIADEETHMLPDFITTFNSFEGYEDYNILLEGNLIHICSAFSIYKPLSYLTKDEQLNQLLRKTATTFTNNLSYKSPDIANYKFLYQVLQSNSKDTNLTEKVKNNSLNILTDVDTVIKEL